MKIESYQDLDTWKLGMDIAEDCYRVTRNFPKEELFGMTLQIRKASASVPANVAEGLSHRGTEAQRRAWKDKGHPVLICSVALWLCG